MLINCQRSGSPAVLVEKKKRRSTKFFNHNKLSNYKRFEISGDYQMSSRERVLFDLKSTIITQSYMTILALSRVHALSLRASSRRVGDGEEIVILNVFGAHFRKRKMSIVASLLFCF